MFTLCHYTAAGLRELPIKAVYDMKVGTAVCVAWTHNQSCVRYEGRNRCLCSMWHCTAAGPRELPIKAVYDMKVGTAVCVACDTTAVGFRELPIKAVYDMKVGTAVCVACDTAPQQDQGTPNQSCVRYEGRNRCLCSMWHYSCGIQGTPNQSCVRYEGRNCCLCSMQGVKSLFFPIFPYKFEDPYIFPIIH
jgi:hypothetical protein